MTTAIYIALSSGVAFSELARDLGFRSRAAGWVEGEKLDQVAGGK